MNYLGIPILGRRSKVEASSFVKEKIVKKLARWKHSLLTKVGREILIKEVASVIPMYSMTYLSFQLNSVMMLTLSLQSFCGVS